MADWALKHLPDVTEQFLLRDAADGVEAKNNTHQERLCFDTLNSCNIPFASVSRIPVSPTFYWNSSVARKAN
jgi:hypothetical protein